MADVSAKCPECGTQVTVSEYANPASVVCPSCGAGIPFSPDTSASASKPRPKLKRVEPKPAEPEGDEAESESEWSKLADKQPRQKSKRRVRSHSIGWALFLVIGGIMWYLRYGPTAPPLFAVLSAQYGFFFVIAVHVLIILKAFKDSIFSGILCLLIPFYSFYYLFVISDDFLLRSVVAGLLVGIGQDSLQSMQAELSSTVMTVTNWIRSGG